MPSTGGARCRILAVVLLPFAGWYACGGGDDTSDKANCQGEGYGIGSVVDDFCGCDHAALACPGADELVSHDACICVEVGADCSSDQEGRVLCGADASVLQCSGGTFVHRFDCPGLEECTSAGAADSVSCGAGSQVIYYALEGQPCANEQAAACTTDQGGVLSCQAGFWVRARTCGTGVERCELVQQGAPGVNCGSSPTCIGCGPV